MKKLQELTKVPEGDFNYVKVFIGIGICPYTKTWYHMAYNQMLSFTRNQITLAKISQALGCQTHNNSMFTLYICEFPNSDSLTVSG